MDSQMSTICLILLYGICRTYSEFVVNCPEPGVSPSRCNKYCGEIYWQDVQEEVLASSVGRSKRDTDGNFDNEINSNEPLRIAINAAREKTQRISDLIKKYQHVPLNEDEVALLIAYTYEHEEANITQFYSDLNADSRNNGLPGGKYPVSKQMLRNALINIWENEQSNWPRLYRREPSFVLENYKNWQQNNKTEMLTQFTSTSKVENAFVCDKSNMYTDFVTPKAGVFVKDFSFIPDEEEVILIPWYGVVTVRSIDEIQIRAELNGPMIPVNASGLVGSAGTLTPVLYNIFALIAITCMI